MSYSLVGDHKVTVVKNDEGVLAGSDMSDMSRNPLRWVQPILMDSL